MGLLEQRTEKKRTGRRSVWLTRKEVHEAMLHQDVKTIGPGHTEALIQMCMRDVSRRCGRKFPWIKTWYAAVG
jgi:hypothetical protein